MNVAAEKFIDAILASWDSAEPWENTKRENVLAEIDQAELTRLCNETGEDYDEAEAEVMQFIRDKK